jgi:hypothetical protein
VRVSVCVCESRQLGLNCTDTTPFPATPAKWTYRGIFRVGDSRVGQWSELGSRDMDGQTREGEQAGECESMEQAGECDGGRIVVRFIVCDCRASAPRQAVALREGSRLPRPEKGNRCGCPTIAEILRLPLPPF